MALLRQTYTTEHVELALGYAITRKDISHNLYNTQFGPSATQGDMTLAEAMAGPPRDEPEITVSQIGDSHVVLINGQDVHACEMREDAERIAERLDACAMEPMPVDPPDMRLISRLIIYWSKRRLDRAL